MKLSKASWLILSAGIFIVVIGALGLTRSQQIQAQGQLDDELGVAELRLSKFQVDQLNQKQADLQKKLDESNKQLAVAKDKLRQSIESVDVTEEFFKIAQSYSVNVTSLSSSSIGAEKVNGIACSVIKMSGVVAGEVPDLIGFIISLNTDFTTGVVKSVGMSISEATEESEPSVSNIQMTVYTYKGD